MLKTYFSRIRTSILLGGCLIWIVAFVATLEDVGAKWKDFQISLIFSCIGLSGLIMFLRREADFVVGRFEGQLAINIGIVLMIMSFLAIIFLLF